MPKSHLIMTLLGLTLISAQAQNAPTAQQLEEQKATLHAQPMSGADQIIAPGTPVAKADPKAEKGTRLVLLGTGGGPAFKKAREESSNAVIVNGVTYIVDAGDGVGRQLTQADIDPKSIRAVFITHNHTDHVADLGTLLVRTQQSGSYNTIKVTGPAPLSMMIKAYATYTDWDNQLRAIDEKRPDFLSLIKVRELTGDQGVVYQDENVKVTAFLVDHADAKPAYGYLFETPDKKIVFSGDTTFSPNLAKYAKGADIMVHEILADGAAEYAAYVTDPNNTTLAQHIKEAHSVPEQVAREANMAGIKTLVLSHFVPSDNQKFDTTELWKKAFAPIYKGNLIVGQDLMVIK